MLENKKLVKKSSSSHNLCMQKYILDILISEGSNVYTYMQYIYIYEEYMHIPVLHYAFKMLIRTMLNIHWEYLLF